jgi:ATP-dependent exoDNAse (exonuclease V) alpha subunit
MKKGTTVLYENKIGTIESISQDIVRIKVDDVNFITIKQNEVNILKHNKGELIKYNGVYYLIDNVNYNIKNKSCIYKLAHVNKFNVKLQDKFIDSNDSKIITINRDMQESIVTYLKFTDRYNSTCNFLNKRSNVKFDYIDVLDTDYYMDMLFKRCKLRMSQLNKIEYTIKKTHKNSIEIKNIIINPFNFITSEYQLITFEKAENIEKEFRLSFSLNDKVNAWLIDLFLNKENTFYIKKWLFDSKTKKFSDERKGNVQQINNYIKNIIIQQVIKGEIYITMRFILDLEKKVTDNVLDMYYDFEYLMDDNLLELYISEFEKKQAKIYDKVYVLDNEQKLAVKNSIKNKLAIITGPPGTGKTEIIKCVLYVFSQLNRYNNSSDDSDDSDDSQLSKFTDNTNDLLEDCFYDSDDNLESSCIKDNDNAYVNKHEICLMAPTGLAFVNMQRQQESKYYNHKMSGTCHRFLYNNFEKIKKHKQMNRNKVFCGCETDECEYDFNLGAFVIDEVSMIDMYLFNDILKMCRYFNSRLILIGDVNQLPSVGPGIVLKKLIDSQLFTISKLEKIKRQQAGALVRNIIKMNSEILQKTDFIDDTMYLKDIKQFYSEARDGKFLSIDVIKNFILENGLNKHNTKFISYFKKTNYLFNTIKLNNVLQDLFNPLNEDFDRIPSKFKYESGFTFRVKDKIIRTENDYASPKMRANGEEAEIIEFDGNKVLIKYSGPSDTPEKIGINELYENFTLNYCVTIHKSQGSQYTNVVFFIEPDQNIIDKQPTYTAISRAKEKCFVISSDKDFINCQRIKSDDKKMSQFMEISDNYKFE